MATKRDEQRIFEEGSVVGSRSAAALGAVVIADPGDGRALQFNEITIQAVAAGPVGVQFRASASYLPVREIRLVADGDGFSQVYTVEFPHPWPASEALYFQLYAAVEVDFFVRYEVIDAKDAIGAVTLVAV